KIDYKVGSGFGFADPYYIFPTLKSLVLHYRDNTMIEHNDALDITLKYPLLAPPPSASDTSGSVASPTYTTLAMSPGVQVCTSPCVFVCLCVCLPACVYGMPNSCICQLLPRMQK